MSDNYNAENCNFCVVNYTTGEVAFFNTYEAMKEYAKQMKIEVPESVIFLTQKEEKSNA